MHFVVFELSINGTRYPASNVILRRTHPLTWAAQSAPGTVKYLLFWQEIPERIVDDEVRHWCDVED